MTTTRGFVERIEAGRGGLVSVVLVNETGRAVYTVSDLDGDPERFNERLTKVGLLRDAMNRAEPVEIETERRGNEVSRVARLTRDQVLGGSPLSLVGGLVLKVALESRNALEGDAEAHDRALIALVGTDGAQHQLQLDLQAPERLVAIEQVRILRDAQAAGAMVQCLVAPAEDTRVPTIVTVWVGEGTVEGDGEGPQVTLLSGFIETLGVILPDSVTSVGGSLALTRMTTSPPLSGIGGSVEPARFDPTRLAMYVARGSVPYALLEAALRDNVRVSLRALPLGRRRRLDGEVVFRDGREAADLAGADSAYEEVPDSDDGEQARALVLAVELDAPLASASRPVWVHIDREMLDKGPSSDCVPGLPSSSLHAKTLRDLRIPYPADWIGVGCFNHGVYRFQLDAPAGASLLVDDEALCLFPGNEEEGALMGYACLEGDHRVRVHIPEYLCDTEFDLDVYRVR